MIKDVLNMTENFKRYLILILSHVCFCHADSVAANYFIKMAPSMEQFLGELNEAHIKSVINARMLSKQYFKKRVQKILQDQKGSAVLFTGNANTKSALELNQIFDEISADSGEKYTEPNKDPNCDEANPNKELGQKLCSWSFEKMMDQALLDHGYSKLTSTVISNITILEKQLFFTNDPNQEFVIIALPAFSLYDGGVNSYQSILNNGVYFVVYKRLF